MHFLIFIDRQQIYPIETNYQFPLLQRSNGLKLPGHLVFPNDVRIVHLRAWWEALQY